MNSITHKKRAERANWGADIDELWALLYLYAEDPAFGKALEELASDVRDATIEQADQSTEWDADSLRELKSRHPRRPRMRESLQRIERFVESWGLNRLPHGMGYEAVRTWLIRQYRVECQRTNRPEIPPVAPAEFGLMYTAPSRPRMSYNHIFDDPHDYFTPLPAWKNMGTIAPVVHPPKPAIWRPEMMLYKQAEETILERWKQHLRAELDRIADAYERAGAPMGDTKPERANHRRWLYHRLAHRAPCSQLATESQLAGDGPRGDGHSESHIRDITRALADEIGVTIPPGKQDHR